MKFEYSEDLVKYMEKKEQKHLLLYLRPLMG